MTAKSTFLRKDWSRQECAENILLKFFLNWILPQYIEYMPIDQLPTYVFLQLHIFSYKCTSRFVFSPKKYIFSISENAIWDRIRNKLEFQTICTMYSLRSLLVDQIYFLGQFLIFLKDCTTFDYQLEGQSFYQIKISLLNVCQAIHKRRIFWK